MVLKVGSNYSAKSNRVLYILSIDTDLNNIILLLSMFSVFSWSDGLGYPIAIIGGLCALVATLTTRGKLTEFCTVSVIFWQCLISMVFITVAEMALQSQTWPTGGASVTLLCAALVTGGGFALFFLCLCYISAIDFSLSSCLHSCVCSPAVYRSVSICPTKSQYMWSDWVCYNFDWYDHITRIFTS